MPVNSGGVPSQRSRKWGRGSDGRPGDPVADSVQRRLAAILTADVAGYSRLMDEEGTRAALTARRTELIEPCIAEHRGRVVKTTWDGLLGTCAE